MPFDDYEEYVEANDLMIKVRCEHYEALVSHEGVCSGCCSSIRICPYLHIDEISCDAKGMIHMESLYYPIFRNGK